jgi:hypothetical protein
MNPYFIGTVYRSLVQVYIVYYTYKYNPMSIQVECTAEIYSTSGIYVQNMNTWS